VERGDRRTQRHYFRNPAFWAAYYRLAEVHAARGEYQEAITESKKALAIKPENVRIRSHLASCYMQTEEYDSALKEFAQAAEIEPESLNAQPDIARVYQKQNRPADAKKKLIGLLKRGQRLGLLHRLLADILYAEENYAEALAEYKAVVLHSKQLVEKHPELGQIEPVVGDDRKSADLYKAAFNRIKEQHEQHEDEQPMAPGID
jgi:tetratricopeptide (TPR) repeat protein